MKKSFLSLLCLSLLVIMPACHRDSKNDKKEPAKKEMKSKKKKAPKEKVEKKAKKSGNKK